MAKDQIEMVLNGRRNVTVTPQDTPKDGGETDSNVTFLEFAITIERFTDGDETTVFEALYDGFKFEGKTAVEVMKLCASHANGKTIGQQTAKKAGFSYEFAEGSQWSIDNTPKIVEIAKDDLDALGKRIAEAVKNEEKSAIERRKAAFALGSDLDAAYVQIVDERSTLEGKTDDKLARVAKAEWGKFLEQYAPSIAPSGKDKNRVGEHRNLTKFDAEYWEFAPVNKAAAKSLNQWHDANRSEVAAACVHAALSAFAANNAEEYAAFEAACKSSETDQKKAADALSDREFFAQLVEDERLGLANNAVSYKEAVKFAKDAQKEVLNKAEKITAQVSKDAQAAYDAKLDGLTVCMAASVCVYSGDLIVQIAKNVTTALRRKAAEIGEIDEPTEKDAAQTSVAVVAKGFHNFDPDEAARHLFDILSAHPEAGLVLDKVEALYDAVEKDSDQE